MAASRKAFVAAARRYVPDLGERDVERARAGVRAQAVSVTGGLVDDFALVDVDGILSVRNAPSTGGHLVVRHRRAPGPECARPAVTSSGVVRVERPSPGVVELVIDRPPLNVLDERLQHELAAALRPLHDEEHAARGPGPRRR